MSTLPAAPQRNPASGSTPDQPPDQPAGLELLVALVARIPEGFIKIEKLHRAFRWKELVPSLLRSPAAQAVVGHDRHVMYAYDVTRRTLPELAALRRVLSPQIPADLNQPSLAQQLAGRRAALAAQPAWLEALAALRPNGFMPAADLEKTSPRAAAYQGLLSAGYLAQAHGLIYDPLWVGNPAGAAQKLGLAGQPASLRAQRAPIGGERERLRAWLRAQRGQTVPRDQFNQQAGGAAQASALLRPPTDFAAYPVRFDQVEQEWVRLASMPAARAEKTARAAQARDAEGQWQACLAQCGTQLRPDAHAGGSPRAQVVARTYLPAAAAKRLGLPPSVILAAAAHGKLTGFTDPHGSRRLAAQDVETAAADEAAWERLAAFATVTARDIGLYTGLAATTVRWRLEKEGASPTEPAWGDVRGKWGLPTSLRGFRAEVELLRPDDNPDPASEPASPPISAARARAEQRRELEVARAAMRQALLVGGRRTRNAALREKLLAVFPAWDTVTRSAQRLTFHLGPTNSGKTFDALNHLIAAGSGWYLAPLRLLAHEVYDTLNRRGVPCNLLTGEEVIHVRGAAITAATIEMFSPAQSGACTVIDEAHLLADPQRGWAWTRALMETRSPDVQVIGAPSAGILVEELAQAAGFALRTIWHKRLTPLGPAPRPWSLAQLPPRTILVAFSRAMVLGLKTDLERDHRRRVSVIYGDLPPEVRRKQAERFSQGETEICVATDAVGMGLNLPADHVVFFETEKFDGRMRRSLTGHEIQQIGGRAGRFGLSRGGQVGALNLRDLHAVQRALEAPAPPLTFARVAPSPEALALLPGMLADRLRTWQDLRSIPDNWRALLAPVDLDESIQLAATLTPDDVDALGLPAALQLVRAPSNQETVDYWIACSRAILRRRPIPRPARAPAPIRDSRALIAAETHIRCADLYLWLSLRPEFAGAGPDAAAVRLARADAAREVDAALQRKIDTARRCRTCGRPLPHSHRFAQCTDCHLGLTSEGA